VTILEANLVAQYHHLRKVNFSLNNRLVRTLSKDAIHCAGRKLGILQRETLVFDNEVDMEVLMDFAIYDIREKGKNAIERMLATQSAQSDSDETRMLQGMSQARYSIFLIENAEPGVGVHLRDVVRGDTHFVHDTNMSMTGKSGLLLAARIITVGEIHMTSGAALPMVAVPAHGREAFLAKEAARLKQMASGVDSPDNQSEFAARIIRFCFQKGLSAQLRLAAPGDWTIDEIDETDETESMTVQHRHWRRSLSKNQRSKLNKRCPCGSGRKYRNCCGAISKKG
jgi:hypothetical protein